MQMKKSHRLLAALLAFVMVVGLLPTAVLARSPGDDGSAEMNEAYAANESLMPVGPSFNLDTLLEWTPESDPDAAYSRASIPLANREGGFVVNPKANPQAKLMLCSMANTDHDNTNSQGSESFFTYAFNYWQYTDSFVYWSGSEEGLVVCPTGEFTDAAHTNGVPVVATLGFPWGSGSGYVAQVQKFVQKAEDGSFPVADKLIAVMDYYGFDGYFFNQESYGCSAAEGQLIDEMMRYMHRQRPDMLISWYDSMLPTGGVSYQNAVNDSNKQFMTDSADGTRAIDQFFMNYNWYEGQVTTTINTMKSIGRSQFDAFAGFNVQANVYGDRLRDYLLVDADGVTRLSLALYYANQTMSLAASGEEFHETEQAYYVNAAGDPRDTSVDVSDSTETQWAGMSRFFADKTPILEAPFVTDFNTGHGKGYYVDGVLSRDGEWSYQSNQDVLPTWTWIIDSEGGKLTGGYDFTTAWNGGSSVKFSGSLSAGKANDIMLYSTKIPVESGMKLGLTCKGDQGLMKLVAYYGDSATVSYEACEKVEYALTASEGDWTTTVVDISAAAGKTLYAIGLKVESPEDVADYQVNLGRLTVTEKDRAPLSAPTALTLEELLYTDAFTAEARVTW
ncbi:MAG: endo-beta-N-acetylglucosaminidase, partial [Clostridiales bacterium]|nr:endo-beta-N-acetylglucosaminidase [Clostridiales bacterium]